MKTKKISLDEIQVSSFLTTVKDNRGILGGANTVRVDSNCSAYVTLHPRCT